MIYVGLFCEWLEIKEELVVRSVRDLFQSAKGDEIVEQNMQAVRLGREMAQAHTFPFPLPKKTLSLQTPQKEQKSLLKEQHNSESIRQSTPDTFRKKNVPPASRPDLAKVSPNMKANQIPVCQI